MTPMPAVVLLSGGQDSTTCLYWARERFSPVAALAVNYGQRHVAELLAARAVAELAGASFRLLTLEALTQLGGSALLPGGGELREAGGLVDADAPAGLPTSYVPGRNLLLLGLAGAYAASLGVRDLVCGASQADYSGYPDCRRPFMDAMEAALTLALPTTCGPLRVHAPLMNCTKADTVRLAWALPGCWEALALTVTCYRGLRPGCGVCPSCRLRARGFAEAGRPDPAAGA